jgi:hypothetical protein
MKQEVCGDSKLLTSWCPGSREREKRDRKRDGETDRKKIWPL